MLDFIFGRAASGKTTEVLKRIKTEVDNGGECILIVPEQFSFESERSLLSLLGDSAATATKVLSFSRLVSEIERITGGSAKTVLSDSEKAILMHKVLVGMKDDLPLFKRFLSSPRFAQKMVDTVCEFKIASVTPEMLNDAASQLESPSLKEKLFSVSRIYGAYDAVVGNKFIDPVDKLTLLAEKLTDCDYFVGKKVFVDSFKGFTGQQFRVIEQILRKADNLTVAICLDSTKNDTYNVFKNTRETVRTLEKIAEKQGIKVREPVVLGECHYSSNELKSLEKLMSGEKCEKVKSEGNITVIHARTVSDEVSFAAKTIRKLVRKGLYRYRDFVVISRNTEMYESFAESEFAKNKVFCFIDKKTSLSDMPVYKLIDAALDFSEKISSDSVFRFLKSGLPGIDISDISLLENYVYVWNIDGKDWLKEWNMNTLGLTDRKPSDVEKEEKKLRKINEIRAKAVTPLLAFSESLRGNVKDKVTAAVTLLKNVNASENLKKFTQNLPEIISSDDKSLLIQSWAQIMKILDMLNNCLDENCSVKDFSETFRLACSIEMIGKIPQMLDEVTFGDAERIRPSKPKVAIILGANQGVFPAFPNNSTLFGNSERKQLKDVGIEIKDRLLSAVTDEDMLVYSCVCCASDKVYICYSDSLVSEEKMPSEFVNSIKETFEDLKTVDYPVRELSEEFAPETYAAALSDFCTAENPPDKATLEYLLKDTEYAEKTEYINRSVSKDIQKLSLSPEIALKLYGRDMTVSATSFDVFHRCRFRYFCEHGLGAKTLYSASLDVLQRGTIVHYALEKFISNHKNDIKRIDKSLIGSEIEGVISEWFENIEGTDMLMTGRFKFLLKKIKENVTDVAYRLADEFAQSSFSPEFCEFKIGFDPEDIDYTVKTEKGSMRLVGSIDRLDRCGKNVRIVDYKTGETVIHLPAFLYGLNLQMMIYLCAALRGKNSPVKDNEPAGILYLLAKKDTTKSGLPMTGLIAGESEIAEAMEKENKGVFIPKISFNKDGSLNKRLSSFTKKENFDLTFDYIEYLLNKMNTDILNGDISVMPTDACASKMTSCKYCNLSSVCCHEDGEVRLPDVASKNVFEKMKEAVDSVKE